MSVENKNDTHASEQIRLGELISKYRTAKGFNQDEMIAMLKNGTEAYLIDKPKLSRLENGKYDNLEPYKRVCDILNIDYLKDTRLSIAFGQGFWAAPVITIDQHYADLEFREKVRFSGYSLDNSPVWNNKTDKLERFDAQKHAFYYSGEILDMLHNGTIDIGFLGSSVVVDDKDVVRVARIVDASSMRHAMVVVAPKGKFKSKTKAIEYLLTPAVAGNEAYIYYQPKSTAEKEFTDFLQWTEHFHDTINVLKLEELKSDFKQKLVEHDGKVLAHLGLALSVEAVEECILSGKSKPKYETFSFRTIEIVEVAKIMGIKDLNVKPFYFEMVVQRSNDKILDMIKDSGFRKFILALSKSVDDLDAAKKQKGIPLMHKVVSDFFGQDVKLNSERIKKVEFELVYYPEYFNKTLNLEQK